MTQTSFSLDRHVLLQFKSGLREQQRELQETIDRVEQDIRDVAESRADSMDLSCSNAAKETMATRNTQNRGKLKLVELALERIRNGSFGRCIACDSAIGMKRLQAVPSASHCIACQERLEQGVLNTVSDAIPTLEGPFIQNLTS